MSQETFFGYQDIGEKGFINRTLSPDQHPLESSKAAGTELAIMVGTLDDTSVFQPET